MTAFASDHGAITGFDVERFLRQLRALDRVVTQPGDTPPISDRWWRAIDRFFRSGKRQVVIRKGRRAGASTIICPRIAVASALYLPHPIPASDVGVYGIVSVRRDEAVARLRGIRLVLDRLGVAYTEKNDSIELIDRPIVFRVLTASYRTEVGSTLIGLWADEVSRWRDEASGQNPAREIFASLRPALATMPFARIWLVSSALSIEDFHARSFDEGDTDYQNVEFGASWDWNPTLTREQAEREEPDPKIRSREWGGIPAASASPAFESDHVLRSAREMPPGSRCYHRVGFLDSAAGKRRTSDRMVWATLGYALPPEPPPYLSRVVPRRNSVVLGGVAMMIDDPTETTEVWVRDAHGQLVPNPAALRAQTPVLVVHSIDSVGGVFEGELVSGELWDRIAQTFLYSGVSHVWGDSYGAAYAKNALLKYGILYSELTWNAESKARAVYRIRSLLADDALVIPPSAEMLRNEMLAFQEKISPSGVASYAARGAGKDDHVAILLNAAMAELEYGMAGSLLGMNYRHVVSGR